MTDLCDKCGKAPPQGQRLFPVTRKNPVTRHYEPRRECHGCLSAPRAGVAERRSIAVETRGTRLIGTANPLAKLDERQARAIFKAYRGGKVTQKELADRYGVGLSTVGEIVRGKKWKHVTGAL